MASTVLPHGIIVPEKFSRDWYADLYHNWQELDNLLGASGPNDGTLTIQKNGTTVGTFSANQSTDETINITVPDVNDATLTIQQNSVTVDTFTANSSTDKTVNISVPTKTSDLNNDSGYITGVSWDDVSNKPSFATVATSGNYNDLSNKPTIPTKITDLTNDSNFITSAIKESGIDIGTECNWHLLHGGLLIQYGTYSSSEQAFNVTFGKPFSKKPMVVACYGDNFSFSTPCAVTVIAKTYFTVTHSSTGGWRVNWVAIGKGE